jgi:hypothetical protein
VCDATKDCAVAKNTLGFGTYLAEAPDLTYTRAQDLPPQMK